MDDLSNTKFYFMHLMPYSMALTEQDVDSYQSTWVTLPNNIYDPQAGHVLYQRYFRELSLADAVGFDGVVVNEHRSSVYSMMPAANIIAAVLTQVTRNAKVCSFGSLVGVRVPHQVAEEYAMLDVISGGRLEVAVPVGLGTEFWVSPSHFNPAHSRSRFREGVEVILKAWREPGPTSYVGQHYYYRYLNVWPKPYQKPHPKIWLATTGSRDTAELSMELGLPLAGVFIPLKTLIPLFTELRSRGKASEDLMFSVFCYVAETDEIARKEAEEHFLWFINVDMRMLDRFFIPPGYHSVERVRSALSGPAILPLQTEGEPLRRTESLDAWYRELPMVIGSPDTVAGKLREWLEQSGAGNLVCNLQMGNMPHWKVVKNITLFAEEVIPRVRGTRPGKRLWQAEALANPTAEPSGS